MTDFRYCGGYCCDPECMAEYKWRKTLYIMNKAYYPKPEKTMAELDYETKMGPWDTN